MAAAALILGVAWYLGVAGLLKLMALNRVVPSTYLPWAASSAQKRCFIVGVSIAQVLGGVCVAVARDAWWTAACLGDIFLLACACATEWIALRSGWLNCGCFGHLSTNMQVTWGTVALDGTLVMGGMIAWRVSGVNHIGAHPTLLVEGVALAVAMMMARVALGQGRPQGGVVRRAER